ncbi:YbaK/EbsC family protein [Arcanobacterium wilhelmae]|uniref:YbaK/EbsC family protein n=1 Tax=Arcanobacterium wilhelmae TaxID=1803177 RepID=UPI0024153F8A|nr:YbaK/EbsC family protein [Arcanobacterium wilhelmae]WFN90144.1 YbaK/EbsC family protein [Arcanobacterium wilhelmae]
MPYSRRRSPQLRSEQQVAFGRAAPAGVVGNRRKWKEKAEEAQKLTGRPLGAIGAIGPIAMQTPMPVVIDSGVLELEKALVSGGARGAQVMLDPKDLVELTGATLAPIVK